jgi:preprotein translocase subunit SecG
MSKVFDILGMVVVLAIIASVIASPNSQGIIKALFGGFSGILTSAKGA